MSIRPKACFEIVCDGRDICDPWDDGTPHFPTEAEAIDYARGCGWVVLGNRVLCPECAAEADCAATGHQWREWENRSSPNGVPFRCRYCEHCRNAEHDPPFDELKLLNRLAGPSTEVTDGD